MENEYYRNSVLNIIQAGIQKKELNLEKVVNNQDILDILKEQTLLPYLYLIDNRPQFKKYYIQAILIDEKFEKIKNTIKSIFDENKIDHIFLKGTELKHLYPHPTMRQMGDIDILVKKKDYKKVINILISNNFIKYEEIDYHIGLNYKGVSVEIHKELISDYIKLSRYLKMPFNHVVLIDNHTFSLDKEFNFLFILIHYFKHLKSGAGLRELCDIYLYLYNYEIDIKYIRNIFLKENHELFIDTILCAVDTLFNFKKYDYNYPYDINIFFDYLILNGIHGYGKNNMRDQVMFSTSSKNKINYLLDIVFIPLKKLFIEYPWTKSIILIPFGYIFRFFYLITHKKSKLSQIVKSKKDTSLSHFGL